jgi:hypothetical protein
MLRQTLAGLLSATLCAACSTVTPVVVQRHPDASLLRDCTDPIYEANPDDKSPDFDNKAAGDLLRADDAYQECKQLNADKAKFLRGTP